ncbi:MAG: glycoside hydrolase family 48 protein, partial [Porcipelethomonas sp.]
MILKKQKAVIAALLSAALTAAAVVPATVSAAGTRTKAEKYGDDSYAQRFLSLYDDVITNGVENGYLSGNNIASGGFGVPYHAVEELIVEAPDYGHETTSEAMSYIVWMAAMR